MEAVKRSGTNEAQLLCLVQIIHSKSERAEMEDKLSTTARRIYNFP